MHIKLGWSCIVCLFIFLPNFTNAASAQLFKRGTSGADTQINAGINTARPSSNKVLQGSDLEIKLCNLRETFLIRCGGAPGILRPDESAGTTDFLNCAENDLDCDGRFDSEGCRDGCLPHAGNDVCFEAWRRAGCSKNAVDRDCDRLAPGPPRDLCDRCRDIICECRHDFGDDLASNACRVCGNGRIERGEECDDGNLYDEDACTGRCRQAACGDGWLRRGVEQCDDGGNAGGDGCSPDCVLETICGNGITEAGEECDDGDRINEDDCTNSCRRAVCGDNVVWSRHEFCDDGNNNNADGCTNACRPARCGDGILWAERETCDDGNNRAGDGCSADCMRESRGGSRPSVCGNGRIEPGEECERGMRCCTTTCEMRPGCGHGGDDSRGGGQR